MIDGGELADALGRITSDADKQIWERALRDAQTESPFVRAMMERALSLVGLQQSDLIYQQLIYPFDSPAIARALALSESGCGLATEAIWREGSVNDSRLKMPYGIRVNLGGKSYAVALEKTIASSCGAWVDEVYCHQMPLLLRGDAPIIGCRGCPGEWARQVGTYEHEFTIVLVEDDGVTVHSVDGGQPGIALRTRKLVYVEDHHELWAASLDAVLGPDGRPSKGRRFQGFTRANALPRYDSPTP